MKQHPKKILVPTIILILMISILPAFAWDIPHQSHEADAMWLEEEETPVSTNHRIEYNTSTAFIGYRFNVTVYLNIDFDLICWQFGMTYNHAFLKATGCWYSGGTPFNPVSQLFEKAGSTHYGVVPNLNKYHNTTHDYVLFGESWASGPHPNASTSPASVAYVEFEIIAIPQEGQTHESSISISALYEDPPGYVETCIQDSNKVYHAIDYLGDIEFQFRWTEPPDIIVTDVTTSKTVVGQGYSVNLTITVENQGDSAETFNVTTCADLNTVFLGDEIIIGTQRDTLSGGNCTAVTFTWNTTGVAKGNYTISTKAIILPGETYTIGNTRIDGTVTVTFPGDVNGDYKVRVDDILVIALAFGSDYPDVLYKANLDINGDGKIRIDDVLVAAVNFGMG
ncbi:MAG: hypothetical protein OEZ29_00935 [Candidatus Bathyarchaeota archaeon]|nr:hypothetical protein [Candidatus Bathyarchaeota archaeon]